MLIEETVETGLDSATVGQQASLNLGVVGPYKSERLNFRLFVCSHAFARKEILRFRYPDIAVFDRTSVRTKESLTELISAIELLSLDFSFHDIRFHMGQ